jgi:hypothetical protein
VNVTKRQYLHPHKFGAGLKLMEFSGQGDSLPQALCILLAHSNGRGGGDLANDFDKLAGSWAGDQIVVAGDYDDPGLFVPEDLKGSNDPLYRVAKLTFEDISDKIIALVAKGDSPYHPWAAMDLSDDGWRNCPEAGVLPETAPKKPAGGKAVWNAYKKKAVTPEQNMVDNLANFLRRHPEKQGEVEALLRSQLLSATN